MYFIYIKTLPKCHLKSLGTNTPCRCRISLKKILILAYSPLFSPGTTKSVTYRRHVFETFLIEKQSQNAKILKLVKLNFNKLQ